MLKIITGMHRSGTSLIANLVYSLGMKMGPSEMFLPANEWNKRGYFENKAIVDMNSKLIIGRWVNIEDWIAAHEQKSLTSSLAWALGKVKYFFLPGKGEMARRAAGLASDIGRLAAEHAGGVLKDTRFSLTIQEWARFAEIEVVLYVYRHPADVAFSLKKRDRLPLFLGMRLWRQHVQRFFETANQRFKIIVVNYDHFFQEERQKAEMERLFRFAGLPFSHERMAEISQAALDTSMRHQVHNDYRLTGGVQKWYARLDDYHTRYDHPMLFHDPRLD